MAKFKGTAAVLTLVTCALAARAETGYEAWLRYPLILDARTREQYAGLPATVVARAQSAVLDAAREELVRGVRGMLGRTLRESEAAAVGENYILLVTDPALAPDAFHVHWTSDGHRRVLRIGGGGERGVLYGAFRLLRTIALHESIAELDERESPAAPARWVNQWDNLDGTIERGYAGRSIFFEGGAVLPDLTRAHDYARLLASIGINGCTVNNVNASPRMLAPDFIPELARIADAFRPWGVAMSIAVDFSSPKTIGEIGRAHV